MLHSEAGDTAAIRARLPLTRCLVARLPRGPDMRCPLYEESRYALLDGAIESSTNVGQPLDFCQDLANAIPSLLAQRLKARDLSGEKGMVVLFIVRQEECTMGTLITSRLELLEARNQHLVLSER